jgi:peroxiredoxin Q/BCP
MSNPEVGAPAPAFAADTDRGVHVTSESLRGQIVVLYFYPKDDTPGCTRQACDIRDSWAQFEQHGIKLFGVSPDSVESHAKFRDKFGLPFPLLADPDRAICEAYGVWVERKNYGRKYMGVERSAFVIDGEGVLVAEKRRIKPEKTVEWALDQAGRLGAAAAG